MTSFSNLPDDQRLAFRRALGALGADIVSYHGPYAQVAIARVDGSTPGGLAAADACAQQHGLVRDDDGFFFPLGTDRPADPMRHAMPWRYGPSFSFWYLVDYRPADA